jgi:hypothetical protein
MPKPEVTEAQVRGAYGCILEAMRLIHRSQAFKAELRPELEFPTDETGEETDTYPAETWAERREELGRVVPEIVEALDRLVFDFPSSDILRLAEVVYPAGSEPVRLIAPTTTVVRAMVDAVRWRFLHLSFRRGIGPFHPMIAGDDAASRAARVDARERSTPKERMASVRAAWLGKSDDETRIAVGFLSTVRACDWERAEILARREATAILQRIATGSEAVPEVVEAPKPRTPPKVAFDCWTMHRLRGWTQSQVAEEMGWGRKGQPKVSRYCAWAEEYLAVLKYIAPGGSPAQRPVILDPQAIDRFATGDNDDE